MTAAAAPELRGFHEQQLGPSDEGRKLQSLKHRKDLILLKVHSEGYSCRKEEEEEVEVGGGRGG